MLKQTIDEKSLTGEELLKAVAKKTGLDPEIVKAANYSETKLQKAFRAASSNEGAAYAWRMGIGAALTVLGLAGGFVGVVTGGPNSDTSLPVILCMLTMGIGYGMLLFSTGSTAKDKIIAAAERNIARDKAMNELAAQAKAHNRANPQPTLS